MEGCVLSVLQQLQASLEAPKHLVRKRQHKLKDFVCAEMKFKAALRDQGPRFYTTAPPPSARAAPGSVPTYREEAPDDNTVSSVTKEQFKMVVVVWVNGGGVVVVWWFG